MKIKRDAVFLTIIGDNWNMDEQWKSRLYCSSGFRNIYGHFDIFFHSKNSIPLESFVPDINSSWPPPLFSLKKVFDIQEKDLGWSISLTTISLSYFTVKNPNQSVKTPVLYM